jgi:hypothetical protein
MHLVHVSRRTPYRAPAHPLNDAHVGWSRDCRQSFWLHTAYRLEAATSDVEELAHLRNYAGAYCGACMTAYTNILGGRVVVAGYYPWTLLHNLAKCSQLRAVCQWLGQDTLPAVVETYARVVVWARSDALDRPVLVLLNASLDTAPTLTLRVKATGTRVRHLSMDGTESEVTASLAGKEHVRLTLDAVAPRAYTCCTGSSAAHSADTKTGPALPRWPCAYAES